jgi:hypothetical protein
MSNPVKTDVFQFMSIRSPQTVKSEKLRNFYINDEYVGLIENTETPTRKLREVFSYDSNSRVGQIIYRSVFCHSGDNTIGEKNQDLTLTILTTLYSRSTVCEENLSSDPMINNLERFPYIDIDNQYYLIPSVLEELVIEDEELKIKFDIKILLFVIKLIEKNIEKYEPKALFDDLHNIFNVDILTKVVYEYSGYKNNFQLLRNKLFDTLYTLYVLRRLTSINLEDIIQGLQAIHTLEFLAVDDFLYALENESIKPEDKGVQATAKLLTTLFPELPDILQVDKPTDYCFLKTAKDLQTFFEATPAIHPIVAQLHWYRMPFNKIKPIGIGDLKVVKQWLLGYKAGEISHIHNIMAGEVKHRTHRHLEKTEEVFSFATESSSQTQTESQTTDRFETKKEAERVVKTDINVGANANFSYNGGGITTSVGANFAYANSNQDTQRTAANYARDVMDRAVTNIQNRSSQSRSTTKIFETEETNKHSFTNTEKGATNISGIYRWLDKKYKAQLYNYGKRLMFEFVVPEPAAFYVMSKLKAAEFDVNVPQKPPTPEYDSLVLRLPDSNPLTPESITEDVFNQLRQKYDLDEFTFPRTEEFQFSFSDLEKKNNLALNIGNAGNRVWTVSEYKSKIPEGYNVSSVRIIGTVNFRGYEGRDGNEKPDDFFEDNQWRFTLNGYNVWEDRTGNQNTRGGHSLDRFVEPLEPINTKDGEAILNIGFQDLDQYSMMVFLGLKIDDSHLLTWKTKVYNKIRSIEQAKIDKINQEKDIEFMSRMSDYRNAFNELNAQTVNDIIQGKSEAFNQATIREELKKHCITMIAKEFDSEYLDDILSDEDALTESNISIEYRKFVTEEVPVLPNEIDTKPNPSTRAVASFKKIEEDVQYPKINIDIAQKKARYIQFLEQAFEWHNIAYIFYPYFWAKESKWIELMNRLDYTDNNMTAFLKAGSVRILVAATPAYNEAVMHFLATREPWEGGPLPVIGDPLFIPIHEEIRKQQDDLQNATPEGIPWEFELPTSLIYLQDSSSPIPTDLAAPIPPPDSPAPTP